MFTPSFYLAISLQRPCIYLVASLFGAYETTDKPDITRLPEPAW